MPITPKSFKECIQLLADSSDKESRHETADNYICRLLVQLGYEEGAEIFKRMEKYYD